MTTSSLSDRPLRLARTAACGVCVVGALVMLGWTLDITALQSVVDGWPKMAPLAAICFFLSGMSLWFRLAGDDAVRQRASQVCAAAAALAGLFQICNLSFAWGMSFDLLGFEDSMVAGEPATRMSLATALTFLFLDSALMCARTARWFVVFQTLVLLAGSISGLGLLRYLYGGEPLLPIGQMSIITAATFALLTIGVFCSRTDRGMMALYVTDSAGGVLLRRLLPPAVIIPVIVGWVGWRVAGWFGTEAGISLFGLSTVMFFIALIWRNAELLHRADLQITDANELQSQLAAIVNSSQDAIIGKTLAGVITSWNCGAENVFGYTAADAIGRPMQMIFPPDLVHEEAQILARIRLGESVQHFETVRMHRNGSRIVVSVTISPIFDRRGETIGASSVARDITARKQAEAALHASEARFRTMADSIPQLAWIAHADGFIHWYNERWYEYTGTTPQEMEGWGWQNVQDPQILPRVMTQWKAAIAAGQSFDMEFPLRGANGHFRRFLTRAVPLKDADGKVVQWFGTNTDVDQLKRVEASLLKSEASLRAAQTRAKIGNWEFDFTTQIGTWSAQMFRLFDRDPARGVPSLAEFATLPHPDDREPFARLFAEAVAAGRPYEQDFRVIRPDGSIRWLAAGSEAILDAGTPARVIGTLQDITERKLAEKEKIQLSAELEQRVIERTAQLEAAKKELEAFSYSVSHDLRAPLRAINGFSQAVLEDYGPQLPAQGQRQLQTIRDGAQRMGQLIDDLLAFSRLKSGPLAGQPVNMGDLVREVLEDLSPEHAGRAIELHVGELGVCTGDRALLRQVWVNLLSNALKYSRKRDPAVITIERRRAEEETIFSVHDNGAGFDMRYVSKLFGVFQRFHRAEEYEGTGVGLAIAQRVIHRHGGRIWAEAVVDQGAIFSFSLPSESKP